MKTIPSNKIRRSRSCGNNIYDNAVYNKTMNDINKETWNHYELSRNPEVTGVIPANYNQMKDVALRNKIYKEAYTNDDDSQFSDDASLKSRKSCDSLNLENDPTAFFKKSNILRDSRLHEKKYVNQTREDETNGFLSQFEDLSFNNPSDPVSANNASNQTGQYGRLSKIETERNLALQGKYSNFTENNDMTYGIVDERNFIHNNMVPNFKSGAGKGYSIDSEPTKQLSDYKQRKMELFTGSSKSLDYRPKTERRPLFNPMVGLTNIYGMPNQTDYYESRYIPSREKRNELLMQPERVTPGLNLGYNEVSKEGYNNVFRALPKTVDDLRAANKPKVSYGGVIIPGQKGEKRPIIPNVAKNKQMKFVELDPRDMVKSLGYYRAPTTYGGYDLPISNRQQTSSEWYGPANTENSQSKPESMMEKYRLPFKENFLSATPRNVAGANSQTYAWDTNTNIPDPTRRDSTQNNGYINPAGPEYHKPYAFDHMNSIPDPTRRDQTQNISQLNPAGMQNKTYAFDHLNSIPDPTRRDQTQNTSQLNPAGMQNRTYAFDHINSIPDPTRRDQTQNTSQLNPAGMQNRTYAFDHMNSIPDPTRRDQTQNTSQLNPAGMKDKTYAFDYYNSIPDPTRRDQTQNKTYQGPLQIQDGGQTRRRADIENALINSGKEQIEKVRDGGAPTTSNYSVAPTMDFTMVQLCEPIQINREVFGTAYGQNPLNCVPTMYTSKSHQLPNDEFRFNTHAVLNLAGNPFLNDSQFKSVDY